MKRILIIVFLLAPLIVVLILLFSGPHMKNNPSFRKFEAVYNLPPEDAEPIMRVPVHGKPSISAGKVYYDYYCVFCHGGDGKGNGPVGQSYVPKPADLNDSLIKAYDSTALYQAAFTGPGHTPILERIIPAEWRDDIIVYVKNKFIKQ